MNTVFWESIRAARPELHKSFNPWDRIAEPQALGALLAAAGIHASEIVAEAGTHPLSTPEDWWSMVLGSGYRGTVAQLDAGSRERVRRDNLDFIRRSGIREVEAHVIYAVAERPSAPPAAG